MIFFSKTRHVGRVLFPLWCWQVERETRRTRLLWHVIMLSTRFQKSYHSLGQLILNRPFPSCLLPLFQNESKCETFHMKMSFTHKSIRMQIILIFIWKISHLDSVWNRGRRQLGNGLSRARTTGLPPSVCVVDCAINGFIGYQISLSKGDSLRF